MPSSKILAAEEKVKSNNNSKLSIENSTLSSNTAIIEKLKTLKPILKERYGIEEFAVFGSVAKDTDTKDSDVDITILKMKLQSGFDIIRGNSFLQKVLNRKIDLGTFNSMKTFIKKDFIYVLYK